MYMTTGKVRDAPGGLTICTSRPPHAHLSDTVTVVWHDTRCISVEQRRKAWALVGEIGEYYGYHSRDRQDLNAALKADFCRARLSAVQREVLGEFSLADVDTTTAGMYIDWLIEFVVANGIPTKEPLALAATDVERYVYYCSVNKVCAVCRRKAGVHHVDAVGMGRNRDDILHVGMLHLPLCWGVKGHHNELHTIGDKAFCDKYHLIPIPIDERIAQLYNLGGKA